MKRRSLDDIAAPKRQILDAGIDLEEGAKQIDIPPIHIQLSRRLVGFGILDRLPSDAGNPSTLSRLRRNVSIPSVANLRDNLGIEERDLHQIAYVKSYQ